jgi:FkbM family methyltransferase
MLRKLIHAGLWSKRHLSGQYQIPELDYLRRFISENGVSVDIGAHAGSWLFPLGKLSNKGRVYGFEALPYYAQVLRLTAKMVGPANITIENCAVTEKGHTEEKLAWKDASGKRLTGFTHLAVTSEGDQQCVHVPTVTLDEYFEKEPGKIQFIKVDVEGAEARVFRGAQSILQRHRPVVFTELLSAYLGRYGYTIADVYTMFEKLNYLPFRFSEGMKVVPVDGPHAHQGNDVLFVPKEYVNRL